MFGLFRSAKQQKEVREEIANAKARSKEQRLLVLEAMQKLAEAKSRKDKRND